MLLTDIAIFLDELLQVQDYPDEHNGIYRPSDRTIERIGLALESWPEIGDCAETERLDALFLHRPWRLELSQIRDDIGILAYHLPFDEHLTIGYNLRLAEALEMTQVGILGHKQGRPLGMIGDVSPQETDPFMAKVSDLFGGLESIMPAVETEVRWIAVVGAMTEALVREASARGAQVYVTGQIRHPARQAVIETGLGVVAVGHQRSEEWGLRALAQLLSKRWPELEVRILGTYPQPLPKGEGSKPGSL